MSTFLRFLLPIFFIASLFFQITANSAYGQAQVHKGEIERTLPKTSPRTPSLDQQGGGND